MARDSGDRRVNRLPWTRSFRGLDGSDGADRGTPRRQRLGLQLSRVDGSYRKLKRWEWVAMLALPVLFVALILIGVTFFPSYK
jgi:hypothetical protein